MDYVRFVVVTVSFVGKTPNMTSHPSETFEIAKDIFNAAEGCAIRAIYGYRDGWEPLGMAIPYFGMIFQSCGIKL